MRTKQFWIAAAAAAMLCTASGRVAAAPSLEKPAKFVTDYAGVFPPARADALNEKLAQFERGTSNQVLVYVEPRITDGTTLEELSSASLRAWGVGQKGRSNGLIFFIFPQDKKMRVEGGYGLEGAIPDARSHRITDEIVKPFFRQGDFAGGIEAGVDALLAAARGEPFTGTGKTVAERRGRASVPATTIPFAVVPIGCAGFLVLLVFAVIAVRKANARSARHRFMTGGSSSSSSSFFSSGSSSGSSSESSSSSDFSGGGGDGGGGGSSDSW
jgi:uncharacterized protein